jgi:GMP synthase (glutamine-hydrolysing)
MREMNMWRTISLRYDIEFNSTFMITLFQHGQGEPPGYLLDLFKERQMQHEIIPLYETNELPEVVNGSCIVFLGGQMSVNDEKEYPWLVQEKQLIRDAISSDIPVLGICLGAQIIASALNCRVTGCPEEKGWFEIRRCHNKVFNGLSGIITIFQWHGESFELPSGSSLLFEGKTVKNQMFSIRSATGVQFHPEVTEEIIRDWTLSEPPEITENIISWLPEYLGQSRAVCRALVDGLTGWGK